MSSHPFTAAIFLVGGETFGRETPRTPETAAGVETPGGVTLRVATVGRETPGAVSGKTPVTVGGVTVCTETPVAAVWGAPGTIGKERVAGKWGHSAFH